MAKTVVIDAFPERAALYAADHTIVAIDVIRATTTAITSVASGRRCIPVASVEAAQRCAAMIEGALLAGELGGNTPYGFDLTNSPAAIAHRTDTHRPLILLSSAGTGLMCEAARSRSAFIACLRNVTSTAQYLANNCSRIAVIGAGTRGEFREEDQLCCAWIAEHLMDAGFRPEDRRTTRIVERWSKLPVESCLVSKSVAYLHDSNQLSDLEFILSHINDLSAAFMLANGEVLCIPTDQPRETTREYPVVEAETADVRNNGTP
jgi:2-phosphosulfolactate phosphatase